MSVVLTMIHRCMLVEAPKSNNLACAPCRNNCALTLLLTVMRLIPAIVT